MTDIKKIAMDAAVECAKMFTASAHNPVFIGDAYRTIYAAMLKADGEQKVVASDNIPLAVNSPPEHFGGRVIGRINYRGGGNFDVTARFKSQTDAHNFLSSRTCESA